MQKYVLAVTYDFDPDGCSYIFDTWEEAVKYMKAMWKYCCDIERKECEYFDELGSKCDEENGTAVLRWDDGELTHRHWEVLPTSEPMKFPVKYYE